MTWKIFFVAWMAGTLGATLGRWFWSRQERRKLPPKKE